MQAFMKAVLMDRGKNVNFWNGIEHSVFESRAPEGKEGENKGLLPLPKVAAHSKDIGNT